MAKSLLFPHLANKKLCIWEDFFHIFLFTCQKKPKKGTPKEFC